MSNTTRTVDTTRLAHTGALSSIPVRRRALSKRTVIALLFVIALVVAALVIASAKAAHAQTAVVAAPCLHCVYVPIVEK